MKTFAGERKRGETCRDTVGEQRGKAAAPKVEGSWKSHRNPGVCNDSCGGQSSQTDCTIVCPRDTFIPTKGWPKSTRSTFYLTSLGCLPARRRGKMPASHSHKGIEAIATHTPTCKFRGASRSITSLCASRYLGKCSLKGDLYSPFCLS